MENKEKNVSLLAEGCLKRGDEGEVRALLSLSSSLGIDYLANTSYGGRIIDLVISKLNGQVLADVFEDVKNKHSLSAWSEIDNKYLIEKLIENKKWKEAENISGRGDGDKNKWNKILENPKIKNKVFSNKWGQYKKELLKVVPGYFMDEMEDYKRKNEWLRSRNMDEFSKKAPEKLSKDDCMKWILAVSEKEGNGHKSMGWSYDVFETHKEWTKWNRGDVEKLLDMQKPGSIFFYSQINPFLKLKLVNLIKEKTDYSNDKLVRGFIARELIEAGEIRKRSSLNAGQSGYWVVGNTVEQVNSNKLKKWGKFLYDSVEKMHDQSKDKNYFFDGMMSSLAYHLLVRTTVLDDRAVNILSKENDLPDTMDDFLNTSLTKNESDSFKEKIPMNVNMVLAFHILKAMESDTDRLKKFSQSISDFISNEIHDDEKRAEAAHVVVVWSNKLALNSKSDEAKRAWAGLFWQNVFKIKSANQHQYLKKALKNPNLQVKLDFWNKEFAKKIEEQTQSRKRTKEISTVLTKMNLIHQIDMSEGSRPKRGGRKF